MRLTFIVLIIFLLTPPALAQAQATSPSQIAAQDLVQAARARTLAGVHYDGRYVKISYPGGDVPADTGVCTDVIIRSYRAALGYDLQKYVHEDMKAHFAAYPKIWGLTHTDASIDHRRVPNLEKFLDRQGARLPVTDNPVDYKPGDLVTWRLGGSMPHIGIVSDKKNAKGVPLILHNVGLGPQEDELLFLVPTYRHYRFLPEDKS